MRHPESVNIHNVVLVEARQQPDWAFPLHSHNHHLEISLVQRGEGTFYCEGRSYPMHPGDLVIKNAGVVHAEHTAREAPLRQVCVSFSGVREIENAPGCLLPEAMEPVLPAEEDFSLLSALFDYLEAHWQREREAEACRLAMLTALEVIGERIARRREQLPQLPQDERAARTVAQVMAWINENYARKITLDGLAERFFISPFYLEKKFKERTGYSINRYVVDRRMGEAQRLLIFENSSIKEVALAVGYDNLQYFYATFKKYAGKTPSDFRAAYR